MNAAPVASPSIRSDLADLDDNKVKLSVAVDEATFEEAVDRAFKKLAREVNIPGFRRGKAPRRVLEAKLGTGFARAEALQDAIPEYYATAVRQHQVDVIAAPEFDITAGEESGEVAFDAVVEVRPSVEVEGYTELTVEVPSPVAPAHEIDAEIDRMRTQFATLAEVDRPAQEGDRVTIDIEGSVDGEALPGLTAEDYLYEVGMGAVTPELDEQLDGAVAGDVLDFTAEHPVQDDVVIDFHIVVKTVQEPVLPDPDDEWAAEASEFDTYDDLRSSIEERLTMMRRLQANMALNERLAEAVAELVDEVPDAMVQGEMNDRLHQFGHDLQNRGISAEQYFSANDPEQFQAELRRTAEVSARVDLALRAIAAAEELVPGDDDIDAELARMGEAMEQDPDEVRARLIEADGLMGLRSELTKRRAMEWLGERVTITDPDGIVIDRSLLELSLPDDTEEAGDDADSDDQDEPTAADDTDAAATDEEGAT